MEICFEDNNPHKWDRVNNCRCGSDDVYFVAERNVPNSKKCIVIYCSSCNNELKLDTPLDFNIEEHYKSVKQYMLNRNVVIGLTKEWNTQNAN